MNASLLLLAALCGLAAVQANSYGPSVMAEIYKKWPEDMPKSVDHRYCCPLPEHQFRYGCHTAATHFHVQAQVCMAQSKKVEERKKVALSKTDFWSCKTHWGVQHGIEIANWWNQFGAFTEEQDQTWSKSLSEKCHDAWTKGGGRQGPLECHCRRFNDTKNPLGPLDMDKLAIKPGFLDEKRMVRCPTVTKSRDDAWKNELRLAYLVWKYGPIYVESSVESFGYGNPNQPSERCVGKGQGGGHNYVVVGFNATAPHKSYWIMQDSIRYFDRSVEDKAYGFGKMWNKCPEKHHLGTESIAEAKAIRYCIKGDARGECGGGLDCGANLLGDEFEVEAGFGVDLDTMIPVDMVDHRPPANGEFEDSEEPPARDSDEPVSVETKLVLN